jgi:hypothetical protein
LGFSDTFIETATWGTPPQNSRNNGIKTSLRVDRGGGASLVKVDLNSVPTNSLVNSAKIKFYNYTPATLNRRIKLYPMLKAWDEGNQNGDIINASGERGATAEYAFSYFTGEGTNDTWGQSGLKLSTDYASSEFSYLDVLGVGWYEADITNQVQTWVRNPSSNFGFFMKDYTSYQAGNPDQREFYSSQYADANLRPVLEVTYNPDTPLVSAENIENFEWVNGAPVQLNGSGSSNGSGEIFSWSILSKAYGSNVTESAISPNNSTGAVTPNFVPDVAGEYTLRLTVTNSLGYSAFSDSNIRVLSIPASHPRIFLTPDKLQFLRDKRTANTADWARFLNYANGSGLNNVIDQALAYQVTGDVAYGTRGVTNLMNYIATNTSVSTAGSGGSNASTVGLGFDWLFPLLTNQQKIDIVAYLKIQVEGQWNINLISWHNFSAGTTYRVGIAGLATYGNNADAKSWIDYARYDRFGDLMLKGFEINGAGGGWPEGSGYEFSALSLFKYAEAVYTATGERLFDSHSWFKDYLSYSLFSQLPQKKIKYGFEYMESPQMGDMERNRETFYTYRRLLAQTAIGMYQGTDEAEKLQWYLNRNPISPGSAFAYDEFLRFNPNQAETEPTTLSHFAPGLGRVFLRSSNTDPNSTHIGFYAGDHYTYHQDMVQGSFTIYKQGDLAVKSGIYDGYGDTGANSHLLAYNSRTISSNSMLVCKPDEFFDNYRAGTHGVNDCGQTSDGWSEGVSPSLEKWQSDSSYDSSDIDFFKDTEDYSYIKSDITNAYNPNKLSKFTRELVYLRPEENEEFVVTFDKVISTDANYEKRWLLHFLNEPIIDGNSTNISLGEDEYAGSLVSADAESGRLFEKALLPKNKKIKKIGGQIKKTVTGFSENSVTDSAANLIPNSLVGNTLSFTNSYGLFNRQYPIISNTATTVVVDTAGFSNFVSLGIANGDVFSVGKDYWVNGKNYPATRTDFEEDYGAYRIEIIPTVPALEDNFLNVMQPTSTSTSNMSEATLIEGESVQGAFINATTPRVVIFSKNSDKLSDASYSISYNISVTGKHLILNLESGNYDVYKNGAKIYENIPAGTDGSLFFTSLGGSSFQVIKDGQVINVDVIAPSAPTGLGVV